MESAHSSVLTASALQSFLTEICKPSVSPVVLCIGTDRLIGDSLGPLTGSILSSRVSGQTADAYLSYRISIYGTLTSPVHARNLHETLLKIKKKHPHCPVIAVDASLGSLSNIGTAYIRSGCLHPGAGVRKQLPSIGDIAITGIVAADSAQPYLSLQTVRLSVIAQMADYISQCILDACITEKFFHPAHEAVSPHQCTPDHRQPERRWQFCLP